MNLWLVGGIALIVGIWIGAVWQRTTAGGNRGRVAAFIQMLMVEMNEMATQLGHEDLHSYLSAAKGEEYANRALANVGNTLTALEDGDTEG